METVWPSGGGRFSPDVHNVYERKCEQCCSRRSCVRAHLYTWPKWGLFAPTVASSRSRQYRNAQNTPPFSEHEAIKPPWLMNRDMLQPQECTFNESSVISRQISEENHNKLLTLNCKKGSATMNALLSLRLDSSQISWERPSLQEQPLINGKKNN